MSIVSPVINNVIEKIFFKTIVFVVNVIAAPIYEKTKVLKDIIINASKLMKSKIVFSNIPETIFTRNVIIIPNRAIGTPHAAAVAILLFIVSP